MSKSYKKIAKQANKHPVLFGVIAIIIVIAVAAALILWVVKPEFYHEHFGVGEHSFGEWQVSKATCTENGSRKRECKWCGELESETIYAEGHSWGEVVVETPATCKENGSGYEECSVCHDKRDADIPATGEHTFGEWQVQFATCTENGARVRICSGCDEQEKEILYSTGHSWGEVVVQTPATCGEKGSGYKECANCDERENVVIPATGEHTLNPTTNICNVCGYDASTVIPPEPTEFSIHFLELGNGQAGDCILIDCGDTEVLIDAGSQQSSASTIKKYVDKYCTDGILEYVISTHGDSDHISGFLGTTTAKGIFYAYQIGTFIKFDYSNKTTQIYNNYLEAVESLKDKGTDVYTASQCYEEKDGAKRQYYLDEARTVSINILYNYYYYNLDKSDENNHSVVTLLTQELAGGNKHYLFTGDLEGGGESKMVDYYANPANSKSEFDILPKVELYKAGHHGSKTSSTAKLLAVIQPKYVAVCCCCGQPEYTKENANTFPTQDMIDRVGVYTDKIYVTTLAVDLPPKDENGNYTAIKKTGNTSMNGDIVFKIKGEELELICSNNDTILKETEWFKENRVWNGT